MNGREKRSQYGIDKFSTLMKIISLGVLLVMCLGIFTGCNSEEKEWGKLQKEKREALGISEETENAIIQKHFESLNFENLKKQNLYIYKYIGKYDDIVAFVIANRIVAPPPMMEEVCIDELVFNFNTGLHIQIWRNSNIYHLKDSYEQNIISKEDLQLIYNDYIK